MKTEMRNAIKLERVETSHGVVKIEGEIREDELVVKNLWAMSTDGWEEIDQKCNWARTLFNASTDIIMGRIMEKYGSTGEQITRVVGS